MNVPTRILAFVSVCLAACTFDAPLVESPTRPIDSSILGEWVGIAEDGSSSNERVEVSEDGTDRYRIVHRDGSSFIEFSGWLAELNGHTVLQLQVTGDESGPVGPEDTKLFSVLSYRLEGDRLEARGLNTELIDSELADTASLQAAFAKHADHADLFSEPGFYRRP